jgi:hypothetical protein
MDVNVWLPVVSALGGALIGSLAPITVGLLNSHAEARRERLRLAVQLALEDYKHLRADAVEAARRTGKLAGVSPIAAVFAYHADVLNTFNKKGELTPEDLVQLNKRAEATYDTILAEQDKEVLTKAPPEGGAVV